MVEQLKLEEDNSKLHEKIEKLNEAMTLANLERSSRAREELQNEVRRLLATRAEMREGDKITKSDALLARLQERTKKQLKK